MESSIKGERTRGSLKLSCSSLEEFRMKFG